MSAYDEYMDEDEIDLVELVSADSKSANQYLVFEGSNNEIYGINVSKVRELLSIKDIALIKNNDPGSFIRATADVRNEMTTIINFDEWFGNEVLEDRAYELIILAGFGGRNIGIMIKKVEYIVNIDESNMHESYANRTKTNFVAKIKLNAQDRLCTVVDCDKMLLDIFDIHGDAEKVEAASFALKQDSGKRILFADDSRVIRQMASTLFKKFEIPHQMFQNGQELLDAIRDMAPETVGLVVTDLEMPIMDGSSLIKKIRELPRYDDIRIVVHTNISNDILIESLKKMGVADVIGKTNMSRLLNSIQDNFR